MTNSWVSRLVEAALDHSVVRAVQTDTFQVVFCVFVFATVLACLDFVTRRRLDAGILKPLGPVAFADQVFSRFPVHVAGGAITALQQFQKMLVLINAIPALLVLALPFRMDWIASEIAAQRGFLLTPRVRDGIAAFETQVLYVLLGYLVVGVLLGGSRHLYNAGRAATGHRQTVQFSAAGVMSLAASVFFIILMFQQAAIFQTFFSPEGESNFGFQLAYNATIGSVEQNLYSQLLLSPVYSLAASAVLAPIAFVLTLGIYIFIRGASEELRARRRKLRESLRRILAPVAPGIVLSFLLTVYAVSLIDFTGETQDLFPTPGFLFLNAVCDAFTIAVTLQIMRRIYTISRQMTADKTLSNSVVLVAKATPWIVLDLLISAALAIAVLVYGGAGAGTEFTVREASFVLFGLSPDGSRFAFNASFWAMHTTFLPTLVFLAALLVAILTIPLMAIRAFYTRCFGLADRALMVADIVAFLLGGSIAVNLGLMWLFNAFKDFDPELYIAVVNNIVGGLL
ncbi:hypothetical protein [Oceanicaulis sp.]|uniref:hypothetical protein n=1 Tax=Oceanicaulis sp. TaxID=1924941 RepID=UPI003D28D7F4